MLLLLQPLNVSAREFIIIANPQAPHKYLDNGVIKGIDADVIAQVMKRLNIKYKIKLIKSAARIIQEAKSGKADMVLLFSKKKSRMEYLIYPNESYVDINWNFFILKENEGTINYENFADLKGLKIGITKGIYYPPEFLNADLTFDLVSQNHLQMKKLLAKRIDAAPLNTTSALYEAKQQGYTEKLSYLVKPLKSKSYYNVFPIASNHPDKQRVMDNYDQILRNLKQDKIIAQIMDKYLKD